MKEKHMEPTKKSMREKHMEPTDQSTKEKHMKQTGKYNTGHMFLAVLGGTMLGAMTVFLVAPFSGHETRKQMVDYFDGAKKTISKVPEALRNASHAAKEAFIDSRG
jgi:hypothetical protein